MTFNSFFLFLLHFLGEPSCPVLVFTNPFFGLSNLLLNPQSVFLSSIIIFFSSVNCLVFCCICYLLCWRCLSSILLLILVNIYMTITLSSFSDKLLIFISLRFFGGVILFFHMQQILCLIFLESLYLFYLFLCIRQNSSLS